MEMEKSKVSIQFLLIFRQSWDVLFFLYARRLRRYTATGVEKKHYPKRHFHHYNNQKMSTTYLQMQSPLQNSCPPQIVSNQHAVVSRAFA